MTEQCDYCGRFIKQEWFLLNDEPNEWVDVWTCSQVEKHVIDHPRDYGYTEFGIAYSTDLGGDLIEPGVWVEPCPEWTDGEHISELGGTYYQRTKDGPWRAVHPKPLTST